MPFFMYLSGYVVFMTGAARITPSKWPAFTGNRAYRLLLPFVLFGLAILVGKLVTSHFIVVDNLPGSLDQGLWGLVWNTDSSPAESVWYIAVLFALSILTPPLLWVLRGRAVASARVGARSLRATRAARHVPRSCRQVHELLRDGRAGQ